MSSTPPTTLDCKLDVTGVSAPSPCSPSRFHLDLFSGIGGFALAAKWNGLQTIGFSEIEPYACKILKRHWPDVPNYGDIRNVRNVRADIITGGFPCQPFSLAGEQRGAEDDRHLWPEMCRVIAEARPAWVLGENVPGIIGLELDNVLSDLENLRYSPWPVIVPAVAVDARHRRDRVWIVAYADELRARPGLEPSGHLETGLRRAAGTAQASLADANETGRREQRAAEPMGEKLSAAQCRSSHAANANGEPRGRSAIARGQCSLWPTEPGVGRVVNGLPNRAHRLKGLGNAIVPQIAANLIRWMLESEVTWMGNVRISDADTKT